MNNRARAGKGLLAALLAAILFAAACAPIVRPPGEPINRPLLAGDFFHTADGLVLPGVGSGPAAMAALKEETRMLEILNRTGSMLASKLDLEEIVVYSQQLEMDSMLLY